MKLDPFKGRTDKRSRILEAVGQLIAEQGFHGLSMARLAKCAGVAAGTLYLYFDDKDDIIREYYDEIHQAVAARLLDGFDRSLPLFEQYRFMWLQVRDFLLHNGEHFCSKQQYENSPYYDPQRQQQRMQQLFAPVFEMYQQGIDSGALKPLPIPLLTSLSLDLVSVLVQKHQHNYLVLDHATSEAAIQASWQAISA